MAYCHRCDKTLDTGAYCPDCGSELVQPNGWENSAARSPDSSAGRDGTEKMGGAAGPERSDAADESVGWGETARPPVEEQGEDYYDRGPVKFSFTYPLSDGWDAVVITAGLLFLGGILVFPYVFVYGYAYRLGRTVIRGDHRPPKYGDWGGLFVDGLLLIVVALPFGLLLATAALLPAVVGSGFDQPLLSAISIPTFVAGLYVGGGILPTFMATGSVRETYRDLRFLEFVRTTNYLKAVLVGFLTFAALMIALFVVIVALVLSVVGILVAIPLALVVQPIIFFFPFVLLAYYFRDAMLEGEVSEIENESTLASSL